MLIIPFYEKKGWKHLPFVSLLLIVINILAHSVVQNNSSYSDAANYYFSSKLYQHEFPHYLKYLKRNKPTLAQRLKLLTPQNQQVLLYKALILDKQFNHNLNSGLVIRTTDQNYPVWYQKRSKYRVITEQITSIHYPVSPAYNSIKTAFSDMFLHSSSGHLIGNMIFLLILGFALEKMLGRALFALAYFGGSVLAVEIFVLGNLVDTPAIGASGAITSLMAIFIVIFGMRKIKFFYSLVFYSNYFRAPAITVLPVWIAHEIYQFIAAPNSVTHYVQYLGGLIVGIIIAVYYRLTHPQINTESTGQQSKTQKCNATLDKAMLAMARLDYREAAALFHSLLHDNPDNTKILSHYHTTLTQLPVTEAYHNVTLQLLNQQVANQEEAESCLCNYRFYLKRTGTSARIKTHQTLKLAKSFARFGLVREAEKIICTAIKHRPEEAVLPELLLILANAFFKLNQEDIQIHYLSLLIKTYPHTEEALIATTFLYEKPVKHLKVH